MVDISSAGAGLEFDAPPEAAEGQRIVVAIHLEGEIRNATLRGDRLRVGTQFLNLTVAERAYLDSQERLAVHW